MTEMIFQFGSFVGGVVYPTYMSYKAVKSPEKEDDVQWLSYWVIYSMYSIVLYFLGFVLYSIPMYGFFEFIGILYLVLPATQGAHKLFDVVDEPLGKNIAKIEELVKKHMNKISAEKKIETKSEAPKDK